MSRPLLATAALALVGFGAYQFFQAPVVSAPVASSAGTPEQQFKQLIGLSSVPAEQLGRLCDAYPEAATKMLKNRVLRLTGSVEGLFVTGLDGRRAVVTLYEGARRNLSAVYDLNHYAVLGLEPLGDRRVHYVLVGNELLQVTPPGIYHQGQHRKEIMAEIRKVVFTRTQPFQDTVTFDRISADAIIVKAAAR